MDDHVIVPNRITPVKVGVQKGHETLYPRLRGDDIHQQRPTS